MAPPVVSESTILAPHDPSLEPDDWPIFEFSDAAVFDNAGGAHKYTSLLNASMVKPLTVFGRLPSISQELRRTLLVPLTPNSCIVKLEDVRLFSYGAYEDGSIGLWAAGRAGWFQISPSPGYRQIYDEMIKAVKILFFIADSYSTPRRSGKSKNAVLLPDYTAQELFERYASVALGRQAGAADAVEEIYKYREFLLSSMIAGKEGISWSRNPMYKHLRRKFPQDWDRARQKLAALPKLAPTTDDASPHPTRQPSVESTSTSSSLKRKRGRPSKNVPADVVSVASSSVASSAAKSAANRRERNEHFEAATSHITSRRSERRRTPSHSESLPDTSQVLELSMVEKDGSDSGSERRPRQAKGALRLKPNKPLKGPPRISRPANAEEDDEEKEAPKAPLSLPTLSGKRKRDNQPIDPVDDDEGIAMPTSASSASNPPSDGPDAVLGASQMAQVLHEPDPVQEDTWVCALAGCTHKVYAVSRPESQALVRQHYALHACDDDERVQLVKKLQAPSLPVAHLIERVKMQAKVDGFPGSRLAQTRFPEPLKQRL